MKFSFLSSSAPPGNYSNPSSALGSSPYPSGPTTTTAYPGPQSNNQYGAASTTAQGQNPYDGYPASSNAYPGSNMPPAMTGTGYSPSSACNSPFPSAPANTSYPPAGGGYLSMNPASSSYGATYPEGSAPLPQGYPSSGGAYNRVGSGTASSYSPGTSYYPASGSGPSYSGNSQGAYPTPPFRR